MRSLVKLSAIQTIQLFPLESKRHRKYSFGFRTPSEKTSFSVQERAVMVRLGTSSIFFSSIVIHRLLSRVEIPLLLLFELRDPKLRDFEKRGVLFRTRTKEEETEIVSPSRFYFYLKLSTEEFKLWFMYFFFCLFDCPVKSYELARLGISFLEI